MLSNITAIFLCVISKIHITLFMQTAEILLEVGQPKPKNSLVQSAPRQDGKKLLKQNGFASYSWEEMRGLSFLLYKEFEI